MRLAPVLKALIAIYLVVFAALGAWAQQVLPVPPLTARVIDTTGTLQPAEIAALDAKLAALETDKGSQVVLLMVPTTAPEDIAAYAQRVGDNWKIGRRNVGDGLLLLLRFLRLIHLFLATPLLAGLLFSLGLPAHSCSSARGPEFTKVWVQQRSMNVLASAISLSEISNSDGFPCRARGWNAGLAACDRCIWYL